jgi:hypothetical protein
LDGPLPKWCPAVALSRQDGRHSAVALFSGFRREDLKVIFYQNMPNLHNRYKSAERKISKKTPNIC